MFVGAFTTALTLLALSTAPLVTATALLVATYAGLQHERTTVGIATRAAFKRANEILEHRIVELEARRRTMSLLSAMSDQLQAAVNSRSAYAHVAEFAGQLFPLDSGALYVTDPTTDSAQVVSTWGQTTCHTTRCGSDRRALHGERVKVVSLASHGERLGLVCLHWSSVANDTGDRIAESDSLRNELAMAFAKQVSLALSNLRLKQRLLAQALHDPLTGLYNRRFLGEAFHRDLQRAARTGHPGGVLMLDLDDFKAFNDAHGHAAGDALLRTFALQLRRDVRAADIACRYGGEEFAVILPGATVEQSLERAELIRKRMHRMVVDFHGASLASPTVSIGVAAWPQNGSSPDVLLRAADTALYMAKANGRDRTEVARTISQSSSARRRAVSVAGEGRA